MKHLKRLLALALVAMLALSLFTACGGSDDEEPELDEGNRAVAGGSIDWPEGLDTTQRFATQIAGDTLYAVFNGIQTRTTNYFVPAGDTITLTGYSTTESEKRKEYRVTLWKESYTGREYVTDGTMYFTADGSCYTGTFTGLVAGERYKVGLAYDGVSFYMSGGLSIGGLAQADDLDDSAAQE